MTDPKLDEVLNQLDADLPNAIDRLMAFVRIPSISTDPAHDGDVFDAATWLTDQLREVGFAAEIRETEGHPMVVGHSPEDAEKTLLFYGHYDV